MNSLIPITEVVHFDATTHSPSTAAVTDADSTPTFDVFEEANDTPLIAATGMTKRTSKTGDYRGSFTVTASAPTFTAGKWYNVVISATVGGITGKKTALTFRVAPAETTAGVPLVDAAALMNFVVEGSITFVQMLRGYAAALMGKAAGMGTTTGTFRDTGDTKTRLTATQDVDGNRTAVTRDLT